MTKSNLVTTFWHVTKAETDPAGVMRWKATTTKFARDVQGDMVTPQFYLKARHRMMQGIVPKPFFSAAHFPLETECLKCGHVYKSGMEYTCPDCKRERLIAGVADTIWIDGRQPKAEGIFHPTRLGKSMYAACEEDIRKSNSARDPVRISMGFFPDLDGVSYPASGQRDFHSGWIEHFAGTIVPVVPEATIDSVAITKSSPIRTRYDDAAAMVGQSLADELRDLDSRRAHRKSGIAELVFKSDAPVKQTPEEDAVDAEASTAADEVGNMAIAAKTQEDQQVAQANATSGRQIKSDLLDKLDLVTATGDTMAAISEILTQISSDDPVIIETKSTLLLIQKALVAAPGNAKAEILARAANLIRSIRDYAHTLVDQPSPVPPAPMPPQTLPENAPEPPVGSVDDQTTELQDLQAAADEQMAADGGLAQPGEEDIAQVPDDGVDSAELMVDGVAPTDDEQAAIDAEANAAESEMSADGTAGVAADDPNAVDGKVLPDDAAAADAAAAQDGQVVPDEQTPPVNAQDEAAATANEQQTPPVDPLAEKVPGKIRVPQAPTDPKKKKNPFAKSETETAADQSVKARAKPDAAVKSAAKHPAEAYLSTWSSTVATVVKDPVLSRIEKRQRVEKALQLFSEQMARLIDVATPVTERDLKLVVQEEVQKAVAIRDAEHTATEETLRREIAELRSGGEATKSKTLTQAGIQEEIERVAKSQRGPRVQRRSLASLQPRASVAVQKSETGMIEASSGGDVVKGVSARDAARISVAKSQVTPYF